MSSSERTSPLTAPVDPTPVSGPEPEPAKHTPEPQKARGAPRIQYARTYVFLPNNLPLGMVLVAMCAAYDARATVGFSADDAGIGELDQRRIVCVNPDQIGTGLN